MDYASPKFREVDIWLWIVEDRRAEQVYEIVLKLHPEYAVLNLTTLLHRRRGRTTL